MIDFGYTQWITFLGNGRGMYPGSVRSLRALRSSTTVDVRFLCALRPRTTECTLAVTFSVLMDVSSYGAAKYGDSKFYGTRYRNDDDSVGDYQWMTYAELPKKAHDFGRGKATLFSFHSRRTRGVKSYERRDENGKRKISQCLSSCPCFVSLLQTSS